jgi:hypothetical protein
MTSRPANLKRLDKNLDGYDRISNIWRQVDRLNLLSCSDMQFDVKERNKFINGVAALQSNIRQYIINQDGAEKQLEKISEDYKAARTITEKMKIIFRKYDLLNEIIDHKIEPPDYSTKEEITEEMMTGREV